MESVFPFLAGLTLRGNLIDDPLACLVPLANIRRWNKLACKTGRKNRLIMLSALAWHYCYMRACCAYSEAFRRLLANFTDARCYQLVNSIGASIAYA